MQTQPTEKDIARFWAKVKEADEPHPVLGTPCLIWQAGRTDGPGVGYGIFWLQGKIRLAHRVAWVIAGRELPVYNQRDPSGLIMSHKCHTKACVNVDHIVAATHRENHNEPDTIGGRFAARDRCSRGHLYTDENTRLVRDGASRVCIECERIRGHAYRRRKAASEGREVGPHGKRTHCPYGHPYDSGNAIPRKGGGSDCRECMRRRSREYMRKKAREAGREPGPAWSDRTHCKNGHPFSGENLASRGRGRVCKTCARERNREYRLRKKTERSDGSQSRP